MELGKKSVNLVHLQWKLKEERELIPKIAAFQAKTAELYAKTTLVDARMVGRRYEVLKKDDNGELVWTHILKAELAELLLDSVRRALTGDRFIWVTNEAWLMFTRLYQASFARAEMEKTDPNFHHDIMGKYNAQNWGDSEDRSLLLITVEEDVERFIFNCKKHVA